MNKYQKHCRQDERNRIRLAVLKRRERGKKRQEAVASFEALMGPLTPPLLPQEAKLERKALLRRVDQRLSEKKGL